MITEKVRAFLDDNQIKYAIIEHSPAYTAQEIAASTHIRGRELAKSVMVRIDGGMAMVVLPASKRVSIEELQRVTGKKGIRLAREDEFVKLFPDCERGAMSPFGNLYGVEVYVDPDLTKDDMIAFNAGTHTEVVRMHYADFERLAKPKLLIAAA